MELDALKRPKLNEGTQYWLQSNRVYRSDSNVHLIQNTSNPRNRHQNLGCSQKSPLLMADWSMTVKTRAAMESLILSKVQLRQSHWGQAIWNHLSIRLHANRDNAEIIDNASPTGLSWQHTIPCIVFLSMSFSFMYTASYAKIHLVIQNLKSQELTLQHLVI